MKLPLSPAIDPPTSSRAIAGARGEGQVGDVTTAQARHPRDGDPVCALDALCAWIPACAGMTGWVAWRRGASRVSMLDANETTGSPACRRESMPPGTPAGFASRPLLHLLLVSAVVAAVWLVVLPALLHQAPIRNHVDDLDARGVDASAMFYTELAPQWLLDHRPAAKTK